MDDFDRAILRVFLTEDAGIDLADVLRAYAGVLPDDWMDREVERIAARAAAEPWAWEALRRLYAKLRAEGEALPPALQRWADDVLMGRRREPSRRGPKPDTGRAAQYVLAVHALEFFGLAVNREAAIPILAEASDMGEDAVRKILDRAR